MRELWLALGPALIFLLCGCSQLVPHKRTESAALKSAESLASHNRETLRQIVERPAPAPAPAPVKVIGLGNKITLPPPEPISPHVNTAPPLEKTAPRPARSEVFAPQQPIERISTFYDSEADAEATANEKATSAFKLTLPLGVTLCLFALGLLLVLFAVKRWRESSAAVAAAWTAADGTLAAAIRRLRTKATASTNAAELAQLNAEIAELEAERGRAAR